VQGTLPPEKRKPAAQVVKELGIRGLYKVGRHPSAFPSLLPRPASLGDPELMSVPPLRTTQPNAGHTSDAIERCPILSALLPGICQPQSLLLRR